MGFFRWNKIRRLIKALEVADYHPKPSQYFAHRKMIDKKIEACYELGRLRTTQSVSILIQKLKSNEGYVIDHDTGHVHYLREDAANALSNIGFRAVESLIEALYDKESKDKKYCAVITDLTVPGAMGGLELREQLHKRDPSLKVIISSGFSEDEAIANYKDFGFFAAIRKPFTVSQLKSILAPAGLPSK